MRHIYLALLLLASPAIAEEYPSQYLHYGWEASTGPVKAYEVEIFVSPGTTTIELATSNELYYLPKSGTRHKIRTRAIGDENQVSIWSEYSERKKATAFPADIDEDGVVAAPDFTILSQDFGKQGWNLE